MIECTNITGALENKNKMEGNTPIDFLLIGLTGNAADFTNDLVFLVEHICCTVDAAG
jgi:hypothetical protein